MKRRIPKPVSTRLLPGRRLRVNDTRAIVFVPYSIAPGEKIRLGHVTLAVNAHHIVGKVPDSWFIAL